MALDRFGHTLAEVEREHILETLAFCEGNRTRAAKFLNISIRGLRLKLSQFQQTGWIDHRFCPFTGRSRGADRQEMS